MTILKPAFSRQDGGIGRADLFRLTERLRASAAQVADIDAELQTVVEAAQLAFTSQRDIMSHTRGELNHPLKEPQAKGLFRDIVDNGMVSASKHAEEELEKDNLTLVDAQNVMRAGVVSCDGWVNGEWRYKAETPRMCFVVAVVAKDRLRIVTGWRKKP